MFAFSPTGENNCSHQCLHWWQQHATGMLRCTLFKSVYYPKTKPIRLDGLCFWSCEPDLNWRPHPYQLSQSKFYLALLVVNYWIKPSFTKDFWDLLVVPYCSLRWVFCVGFYRRHSFPFLKELCRLIYLSCYQWECFIGRHSATQSAGIDSFCQKTLFHCL